MFEKGEIVVHDNLYFSDNVLDNKKNRPCIVLFTIKINNVDYVCTCPLTSNISRLNKCNYKYMLVPEVIYKYRVLSIAKIDSIALRDCKDTRTTNLMTNSDTLNMIIKKVLEYPNHQLDDIKRLLKNIILMEIEQEKLEEKKKKILRKEKRQQCKRA